MQAMFLPAEVGPSRHLSAFLISLPLNASPEGSLVFRSAVAHSTKAPFYFNRRNTSEEMGHVGTSANFLSFRTSACRIFPVSGYCPSLLVTLWRKAEHLLFPLTSEGVAGTQHLSVATHGHLRVLRAPSTSQLVHRGSGPGRGSGKVCDKL